MKSTKLLAIIATLGMLSASFVFAQTSASVTPLTPGWGGPNYDQPLWTITYNKAIIPVSFTSYNCTSAALVLEYATWADYTKLDWQTGKTNQYTGFIPASASDLSQKVNITIPNLSPSTSYIFRVGAKCTSSSPMGTLAYTVSANQFSTPAAPSPSDTMSPDVPFNLTVNDVTSTHVSLGWSFRSDDRGITRWELKYKTSGDPILDGDWASASSLPMTQSASPLTVGGTVGFGYNELTPNTTYTFGLKAYDAAGNASLLAVFPSFTTLALPPPSIPVAPTGLTASYSTFPNGPEVQLNINDNATNETEYRLYWHLTGTAWPSTFQPTGTSTWSFPINVGNIQIAAPTAAGNYEYQIYACNSAGCSASNIASVNVPSSAIVIPSGCTDLVFSLIDNKTSYNQGEYVNYSYKCTPAGTSSISVTIQVVKPDGTATTYVTGSNVGAVLQQMGFSTSNLAAGSYILRACLNDTLCGAGSVYPLPFTVVGGAVTPAVTPTITPTIAPIPVSTPAPSPNSNQNSNVPPASTIPSIPSTNGSPSSANAINPPYQPTANQPIQNQAAPPIFSGAKCTRYLGAVKSALDSNERSIKKIKQKMRNAPENYVNFDAVTASFATADEALRDTRDILKKKECSARTIESIRDGQGDIGNALQDISGYDKDEIQHFGAYALCKTNLSKRTKRIGAFVKKERSKKTKSSLGDAVSQIAQKSGEFAKDASDGNFPEVINRCTDYIKGLDDDINFYLRTGKF